MGRRIDVPDKLDVTVRDQTPRHRIPAASETYERASFLNRHKLLQALHESIDEAGEVQGGPRFHGAKASVF